MASGARGQVAAGRSGFSRQLIVDPLHLALQDDKVPRPGTARRHCVTRMSAAGVVFPTGDFLSDGLPAPRSRFAGRGPSHFCSPRRANKSSTSASSSPRSTGVSGLNLFSGVGPLRPEGKYVFVLATPWRRGRREEFDNRSRSDQGQGNIQHCHHASGLAHPVPQPVALLPAGGFAVTVH
jgi:hypothetical protein